MLPRAHNHAAAAPAVSVVVWRSVNVFAVSLPKPTWRLARTHTYTHTHAQSVFPVSRCWLHSFSLLLMHKHTHPLHLRRNGNPECTYHVTGPTYTWQPWYNCFTCGLLGDAGVCASCAYTCHAGHNIRPAPRSPCNCKCICCQMVHVYVVCVCVWVVSMLSVSVCV